MRKGPLVGAGKQLEQYCGTEVLAFRGMLLELLGPYVASSMYGADLSYKFCPGSLALEVQRAEAKFKYKLDCSLDIARL